MFCFCGRPSGKNTAIEWRMEKKASRRALPKYVKRAKSLTIATYTALNLTPKTGRKASLRPVYMVENHPSNALGLSLLLGFVEPENLPEILEIAFVLAHALFGRIGNLGDGLAVAFDHLDDDVQGLRAAVVHKIGADAEA